MKIPEKKCFIVAEISANHNQDFNKAVALIKEAKLCGADAVKFQTYTPDTLTLDIDNRYFRIRHSSWRGETLYHLYKRAFTPRSWFKKLKKISDDLGILFFSTAFDKSSVDFLQEIGVPMHKISSFELVDLPLIRYIAKTKKPLILSTGMATYSEIHEAVEAAKASGAKQITLLKCVSGYPANHKDMDLKTIPDMKKRFGLPVGISDHTLEISVSVAAVALGASVIEKHFTFSREKNGPDSFFSTEPGEFKELVRQVRIVEQALGKAHYGLSPSDKKSRLFRRSLFAVQDINKGEIFNEKNIRSIRPSFGLKPKYQELIFGKKAKQRIKRGTPLKWNHIET